MANDKIEDIGEAPQEVRDLAATLEKNYAELAKKVPAWKRLEDVYRGIVLLELMESKGVPLPTDLKEKEIRSKTPPESVEGLAAYHVVRKKVCYTVGGIDFSVRGVVTRRGAGRSALLPALSFPGAVSTSFHATQ